LSPDIGLTGRIYAGTMMTILDGSFWRNRAQSFQRDERGGILIIFGLALFALVLVAGGAVEIHRRSVAKQELQNAADTAALAGKQREVYLTAVLGKNNAQGQGKTVANNMFKQQIKLSTNFKNVPSADFTWNADGSFTVTTTATYKVLFGDVLPTTFSQLDVKATVDFTNAMPSEVALVLDNTMSMFNKDGRPDTRFTLMRNAAKQFTHQMFNASQATGQQDLVRMAVVPWATTVNVLGGAPATSDFTGDAKVNSIPDFGSRLQVASPLSRAGSVLNTGAAAFAPVPWRGCVSGATENPTTYTDAPNASFESMLVPAAPKYEVEISEGPLKPYTYNSCTCTSYQDVPCGPYVPPTGTQGFHKLIEKTIPQIRNARLLLGKDLDEAGKPQVEKAQCSTCVTQTCGMVTVNQPECTVPTATRKMPYCHYWHEYGRRNSFNPQGYACTTGWWGCYETGKGPTLDSNAPACVADPNEPGIINNSITWCPQYYEANAKVWDEAKPIAGPNMNCVSPMLGLSGNRKQVLEYIDRMTPVPGGTHADVGLRWGLRAMSAGWSGFFGLTKPALAWGNAGQKAMILITDGENEQAVDFPGYWGCNDTGRPGCSGSADASALDTRMQGWCDAIRTQYKITLYVIAVNFTNAAAVQRLKNCAANDNNVFNVDAGDLTKVLSGIAGRVLALRLTQ
jgi:Flp pilus assembly protein TadG